MELNFIKENPDGSADYCFDLTDDEKNQLIRFAIRRALEEAVKAAKEWDPNENSQ